MLKFTGQKVIELPPAELWVRLMDPVIMKRCIPRCEVLEPIGDGRFLVALKVRYGLVRGTFRGEAELKDVVEVERYILEMQAKGILGSVHGTTEIQLLPVGGGVRTELIYASEAKLGGLISKVGAKFHEDAARTFTDQFFDQILETPPHR
ncbi:MAG TPA: carbon monoxide dehydrogenase subunit G [Planctomycetota bacterium]|nr:carbon monoxide dehydrogenase subunit G [Planctomycetota bacterium]